MNRLAATTAAILALALPGSAAVRADDIAALESASGVAVQASVEGGDRLDIAIVPGAGIRLNGRLGVSFADPDEAAVWGGTLPLLVLGEGDYFTDPVLQTLHMDPALLTGPVTMTITFGSCLPVTAICVLEEALLTVTPGEDGAIDLTLAALEP